MIYSVCIRILHYSILERGHKSLSNRPRALYQCIGRFGLLLELSCNLLLLCLINFYKGLFRDLCFLLKNPAKAGFFILPTGQPHSELPPKR
jgi:hypothetical protein